MNPSDRGWRNAADIAGRRAAVPRSGLHQLHLLNADSKPALKGTIKPKLLTLLQQYRLKLPLAVHQERTVEAGALLASLGEHETALRQCYSPILATASSEGLAASGMNALRLRVQDQRMGWYAPTEAAARPRCRGPRENRARR